MRFLKNSRYIDILLFVSFLPLFFALPLFMKVFVVLGIYLAYKKKTLLIAILGFAAIFFSFNIFELKNFDVYVRFLVSLLIWAVLMQRTKEENFYLKISPYLFFGFSIVIFQNIYMLIYAIFEIFVFLYFAVKEHSKEPLKTSLKIFIFSLPVVVILFLFFPRVSQKHFLFGFTSNTAISGFSNVINTNTKSIKLLNLPVLELKLPKSYGKLYLRGAVFYKQINGIWVKGFSKDKLISFTKPVTYTLKEYPTLNRVIFGVDLPIQSNYGYRDGNFIFYSKKTIKRPLFVKMTSVLNYELKPLFLPKGALEYDKNYNKNAQKLLKPLLKEKNINERLKKLIEIFKAQKVIYTRNPGKIDGKNIVDELFSKKKGFCIHFASAFAIAAKIVKIPSRVVSGYMVSNNKNGYYKVYEKNAHAWVEVLINDRWKRIDPTDFAYKVTKEVRNEYKIDRFDFYMSYVRFLVEEWVLRYNTLKQKKFFKFLKAHFFEFLALFSFFVVLIFIFAKRIDTKKELLQELYKKLGAKPQNQSVYKFLKQFNDPKLDEINELYNKITFYKSTKSDIKKLKRLIKEYRRN